MPGFEPLEHVRDDQLVVLGLVTTKTPRVETVEWLSQRIRDAARILPLERLALGTNAASRRSHQSERTLIPRQRKR